jgi:hypothetical protein
VPTADQSEKPVSAGGPDGARAQPGARRPMGGRVASAFFRSLPGAIVGVLLGTLVTLTWQLFVVGDEPQGPFSPAPQPREPDVVLTLSYRLIGALIQQELQSSDFSSLPLRDIRTGPGDGRLVIRGAVRVLGQDIGASVELEPRIEGGTLRTRVARARLGPLPVPSNLSRLAEEPLNRELTAALANLPATLTSVRVGDAGLIVTADVRIEELPFFQGR